MPEKFLLSEEEWRKRLTPEEYRVLRQHGTEPPWEGCFVGTNEPGTYVCRACGNPLFRSGEKFESGTGWPSFTRLISEDALTEHEDRSFGMISTEFCCARCESNFCHVFPDVPLSTALRYFITDIALK